MYCMHSIVHITPRSFGSLPFPPLSGDLPSHLPFRAPIKYWTYRISGDLRFSFPVVRGETKKKGKGKRKRKKTPNHRSTIFVNFTPNIVSEYKKPFSISYDDPIYLFVI